jgi:hypothetical protein
MCLRTFGYEAQQESARCAMPNDMNCTFTDCCLRLPKQETVKVGHVAQGWEIHEIYCLENTEGGVHLEQLAVRLG